MSSDEEAKKYSEKLEKLGLELSKIQYDFKIRDNPSVKYWEERIQEFTNYHKKVVEYFSEASSFMRLSDKENSEIFFLRVSKLLQLGRRVLQDMEKIKQNPSTMNLKDKQQSKWSKELRDQLIKSNKDCLEHEKRMNVFFKNFYEKYLLEKK